MRGHALLVSQRSATSRVVGFFCLVTVLLGLSLRAQPACAFPHAEHARAAWSRHTLNITIPLAPSSPQSNVGASICASLTNAVAHAFCPALPPSATLCKASTCVVSPTAPPPAPGSVSVLLSFTTSAEVVKAAAPMSQLFRSCGSDAALHTEPARSNASSSSSASTSSTTATRASPLSAWVGANLMHNLGARLGDEAHEFHLAEATCRATTHTHALPAHRATTAADDATGALSFYAFDVTGDTVAYFKDYLCRQPGADCSSINVVVTQLAASSSYPVCNDNPTRACYLVEITGSCWGVPAMANYVNDVRATYLASRGGTNPWGGNSSANVGASMVVLETPAVAANEGGISMSSNITRRVTPYNVAEYTTVPRTIITCNSSTGMWAFSLLVLLPFMFFVMRYAWYRGRRTSKEKERLLVIADERRNMQNLEEMRLRTGDVNGGMLPLRVPPPGMSATNFRQADVAIDDDSEVMRNDVGRQGREGGGTHEQHALHQDHEMNTSQQNDQTSQQQWMVNENGDYYTVDEDGNYYKYDKNAAE